MPYRIAGIDVHKKMLAVVVSDVEVEGEYQFERRQFGSNPEQLRSLAEWLLEQEVEEVVMESTAQYWRPVWGALERYWKPMRQKREGAGPMSGTLHLAQAQSNRGPTGAEEGFPRCRTSGEAAGGPRTDPELCARCRAASVADGDAPKVPADAQPGAAAEPSGESAGRGAYQVVQFGLGSAGRQCTAHAEGAGRGGNRPSGSGRAGRSAVARHARNSCATRSARARSSIPSIGGC